MICHVMHLKGTVYCVSVYKKADLTVLLHRYTHTYTHTYVHAYIRTYTHILFTQAQRPLSVFLICPLGVYMYLCSSFLPGAILSVF